MSPNSRLAGLELMDLTFSYPDASKPAVNGLDLVVEPGELVCLLGPSGCGKTTILKAIAGLLTPNRGDIRMNGESLVGVPTEKRSIGMVFQKPLLFPHLSVGANVAFGLRMRRLDPALIKARVGEMLRLVQLEGMEDRRVTEISGGQSQRVALARALIIEPGLWLLDEPLSQLDANLREEMRELIRSIQRQLGVTTLFVTHDQEEAVVLADRIGLVLEGRLQQIGPPTQLFETPATVEVARFLRWTQPGRRDGGGRTVSLRAGDLQDRTSDPIRAGDNGYTPRSCGTGGGREFLPCPGGGRPVPGDPSAGQLVGGGALFGDASLFPPPFQPGSDRGSAPPTRSNLGYPVPGPLAEGPTHPALRLSPTHVGTPARRPDIGHSTMTPSERTKERTQSGRGT